MTLGRSACRDRIAGLPVEVDRVTAAARRFVDGIRAPPFDEDVVIVAAESGQCIVAARAAKDHVAAGVAGDVIVARATRNVFNIGDVGESGSRAFERNGDAGGVLE